MTAQKGDRVTVLISGKTIEGFLFMGGENPEPLTLTLGENTILPALENAIIGMHIDETKKITLSSENSFGPHFEDRQTTIERTLLPSDVELEVNGWYMLDDPGKPGQKFATRVISFDDNEVTLDTNHPLAGKDVVFDITLIKQ